MQVGYLRPSNRAKQVRNLYFVGASSVPGAGVPLVILGSRLVSEWILAEQSARSVDEVVQRDQETATVR